MFNCNGEKEDSVRAVFWSDDHVCLLDQRQLPQKKEYLDFYDVKSLAHAITRMVVRGAPAIGITAAYGVVLAAREAIRQDPDRWQDFMDSPLKILEQARPTAVNLHWALERMRSRFSSVGTEPEQKLLAEAIAIHEEDIAANMKMGELGAALIQDTSQVLTHCNAGALATGGYGTALGVIRSAHGQGLINNVYVCETRPWLQGARLTAWELQQDNIPVTLIADSAASHLFKQGQVGWVIVGADRIAANGDVANKIGTYALAVSARYHGIQFMVVAPTSTIDRQAATGSAIPLEERAADEISHYNGHVIAPGGVSAWNPAFDITPADLIDVIVTEEGAIHMPDEVKISGLFDPETS